MGTSFVHIGENGFWMRDSVLELWLRLLSLHIEDPIEREGVAATIRDKWLLASRGFFIRCVPTDLDEAISTAEGMEIVIEAIQSVKKALESGPPTIDKNALNLLGFSGVVWVENFETRRLIEVADAFLSLLDGKITDTARSTTFTPGSQ